MPLPNLSKEKSVASATMTVEIPGFDKKIKMRFMQVSEQKILLMAKESDNEQDTRDAMDDILDACNMSRMDIRDLQQAQKEYLFIRLVAASSGRDKNVIPFTCRNIVDEDKECGHRMNVQIDYTKVSIAGDTRDTQDFQAGDWTIRIVRPEETPDGHPIRWAHKTISHVFNKESEESYNVKEGDFTEKEAEDFWDGIPPTISKDVVEFLADAPRLETTLKHKCESCSYDHSITLSGLQNFF